VLEVTSASPYLRTFPGNLSGTSGGPGGQILVRTPGGLGTGNVYALAGSGGAGGCGLLLVCRGLGFGANGYIDLSGEDGASGATNTSIGADVQNVAGLEMWDWWLRAGGGGGGLPGALYVLLDGDGLPYPDLNANTLRANRGATPVGTNTYSATWIGGAVPGDYRPYPGPLWPADLPQQGGNPLSPALYLTGRAPISGPPPIKCNISRPTAPRRPTS
jgi:hypothetical protein